MTMLRLVLRMKGTYAYTTKVSEALRARPETLQVLRYTDAP